MPKKIKVITIQQNQLLEIPNDNIEIEAIEDNTGNQQLSLEDCNTENQNLSQDIIELVESQDVIHDLTEPLVKVKNLESKRRK